MKMQPQVDKKQVQVDSFTAKVIIYLYQSFAQEGDTAYKYDYGEGCYEV